MRPDGKLVGPGIHEQARQIFDNLHALLADLKAVPSDLLYINTYLTSAQHLEAFQAERNAYFAQWFPDGRYPGSTLLIVAGLVAPEYLMEVDAVVAVGHG
ncbi:RidA family protein [Streptomyces hygroscopicus]|uniref:RidA family protein n=1 Tax=Streptomyces hygroscopicus TaxID=1912 RepID=UPI003632DF17